MLSRPKKPWISTQFKVTCSKFRFPCPNFARVQVSQNLQTDHDTVQYGNGKCDQSHVFVNECTVRCREIVVVVITTRLSWTPPPPPLCQRLSGTITTPPARLLSYSPLWTNHTTKFRPSGRQLNWTLIFYIFIIHAGRISITTLLSLFTIQTKGRTIKCFLFTIKYTVKRLCKFVSTEPVS
jgi:hypothetical protein